MTTRATQRPPSRNTLLLSSERSTPGREPRPRLQPMNDRDLLRDLINELAVVRGRVTLASGREADYYIDVRRVTLDGVAAPLVGRVMRELVADWDFDMVGGLTMGADPVAVAMLHQAAGAGDRLDAYVVRKDAKTHGLHKRIEGAAVEGKKVLVVEDTSTTGGSALQAISALRDAGAQIVGVAVVVDRNTGAAEAIEAAGLPYRFAYGIDDLVL